VIGVPMTIFRNWLLILPLVFGFLRPSASVITISDCTELAFDSALAAAHGGDMLRFGCHGTLTITATKVIASNVEIDGAQGVTLLGHDVQVILRIEPQASVRLTGITVSGGRGDTFGGAINNQGNLSISDSTFIDNSQAIFNAPGAALTISDSLITKNEHGLLNYGGTLEVNRVTFADNVGDGIYNSRKLTVIASTFTGNAHGIDNGNGDVTVANSLFYGNKTVRGQMGAGIANSGLLTVLNSTFLGNAAEGSGAGIGNHNGGQVILRNTIIADSTLGANCFGPIIDGGHNLQYPAASCGATIPSADPHLTVQAAQTTVQPIAFSANSPLIGAGDVTTCTTAPVNNVDQRGYSRLGASDPTCDIGAFEISTIPSIASSGR
jgi:hypothetical protein